jgi:predicted DNA-binding transcriptional regulator YafY
MNRTERFYRIDQLLSSSQAVAKQTLLDELEISWATLKRDIAYMRDRLNAPILFDSLLKGYRFDTPAVGPRYELPGLWFSPDETYALLNLHQLLSELDAVDALNQAAKEIPEIELDTEFNSSYGIYGAVANTPRLAALFTRCCPMGG